MLKLTAAIAHLQWHTSNRLIDDANAMLTSHPLALHRVASSLVLSVLEWSLLGFVSVSSEFCVCVQRSSADGRVDITARIQTHCGVRKGC